MMKNFSNHNGMPGDFYEPFRLMCRRRGGELTKVESVAFNVLVTFGLATGTFLLPVVANSFYWVNLNVYRGAGLTGAPMIEFRTNSGQGSAGVVAVNYLVGADISPFPVRAELDSMVYLVGTHSAGSFVLAGEVYLLTYA